MSIVSWTAGFSSTSGSNRRLAAPVCSRESRCETEEPTSTRLPLEVPSATAQDSVEASNNAKMSAEATACLGACRQYAASATGVVLLLARGISPV